MWERSLLCDVRIAADDAKFRLPELAHGLIPDSGGTARLFQICGPSLVSDLVLTTRVLDADEALRHGIVSRVVPRADLDDEAHRVASTIASMSPLAVRAWRQILLDISTPTVQKAIHDELLGADARVHLGGLRRVPRRRRRGPPAELPDHLTNRHATIGTRVTSGSRWGRASPRTRARLRSCCG